MFDAAFSFRGRIGRLDFLLDGLVMVGAALVAATVLAVNPSPVRRDAYGLVLSLGPTALVAVAFACYGLSLRARRILGSVPGYVASTSTGGAG